MLSQLYERYSREIYLYLFSMCRSREAAEDLTQECFVRALLALPEEHGNMRAWLFRVARNLLFDQARRGRREVPLEDWEDAQDPREDPLAAFLRDEERRRLLRQISSMDRRKREVLILQYYSGLRQKEIAALLGLTEENVRVLSLRARRELKKKLEEEEHELP